MCVCARACVCVCVCERERERERERAYSSEVLEFTVGDKTETGGSGRRLERRDLEEGMGDTELGRWGRGC